MSGDATTPEARDYSVKNSSVYVDALVANKYPVVTTNPNKLEEQAKEYLGIHPFNYVAGGAGERATMDANRLAFRQWKIVPRMLRKSINHDLRTTLFGHALNSPIFMAPVGVHGIFHTDREIGSAKAAASVGVPYSHSTAATTTIEDAAAANSSGLRFYQLYWPRSDDMTLSLLKRAKESGYKVLLVTLDTWYVGWRPEDLDKAYVPFLKGVGVQVITSDPVFRKNFAEKYNGKTPEDDPMAATMMWQTDAFPGKSRDWEDLKLLRENWDGPIVLKGIQHVEDAKLALQYGMDGIYVSNHGGRQLDGCLGSLDALAEISEAVGDQITILFDSGVRTGADVIKALCLGAHAVGIGRPFVYGLAINGQEGVKDVLENILADLDLSMGLAGITSIKDCKRSNLRKTAYPADRFSNN